jgi:hypothetical protein
LYVFVSPPQCVYSVFYRAARPFSRYFSASTMTQLSEDAAASKHLPLPNQLSHYLFDTRGRVCSTLIDHWSAPFTISWVLLFCHFRFYSENGTPFTPSISFNHPPTVLLLVASLLYIKHERFGVLDPQHHWFFVIWRLSCLCFSCFHSANGATFTPCIFSFVWSIIL